MLYSCACYVLGPLSSEQRTTVLASALAAGLEPSILLAEGDDTIVSAEELKRTIIKEHAETDAEIEKEGDEDGSKSPKHTAEVETDIQPEPVKSPIPRAISERRPIPKTSRMKCGGISRVCGSSLTSASTGEKTCNIM